MKNISLLLLCTVLLFASCHKEDNPVKPPLNTEKIEFKPSDSTKFPSKLGNLVNTTIDSDKIILQYSGTVPQLRVGTVLVDSVDKGYCRKITSIQSQGNTLTISTSNAKFTDAFKESHISKLITIFPNNQLYKNELYTPFDTSYIEYSNGKMQKIKFKSNKPQFFQNRLINNTHYDFAWVLTNVGISIYDSSSNLAFSLSADSLTLGMNMKFDFKLDETESQISKIRLVKIEDQGYEMKNINLTGEKSISLLNAKITPINIPVLAAFPVGWLVFTVGFKVNVGLEASLTGSAKATLNMISSTNHHTELGAEWINNAWSIIDKKNETSNSEIYGTSISGGLSINAKYYIEPIVDISLYSIIGPEFFLKPGFPVQFSYPPPSCNLQFSVEGGAKFALTLFDLPFFGFSATLYNRSLGSGCGQQAGIPTAPQLVTPAQGTTVETLSPTLVWNNVLSASNYRIQLSTNSLFSSMIIDSSGITDSQYTVPPDRLIESTKYYWRVNASNLSGTSPWAQVWDFNTGYSTSDNVEMLFVQGGTFQMGSNSGDSNELPIHSVTLSSFRMSKYEITYQQWKVVRDWAMSNGYADLPTGRKGYNGDSTHPVTEVNWYDIVKWCNALSEKNGRTPVYYTNSSFTTVYKTGEVDLQNTSVNWSANGFRLPTEAEWEFAARGGMGSNGYAYSGSNDINSVAWHYYNSGANTHTVGTKAPNELGLYDMSGNVWEWCWDWYNSTYYNISPLNNPQGPTSGICRLLRGGSFLVYVHDCRVADRNNGGTPGFRHIAFGFRVVGD